MTKDEIKKALEICTELCPELCKRFDCPYYTQNCTDDILKDALNIINEQENEIELLKMQMKDVVNHADTFLAEEQKFEAKNVKLKAKIEDLKDEIIYLERKIAIRDNALKDRDKAIEMLEGKQDAIVKQAKIDILNTARERCDLVAEELEDEIDHYGSSAAYSCAYEIKELIKEVENEN